MQCGKRGRDLVRVVGEIVDDRNAVCAAHQFQSAPDAGEARERRGRIVQRNFQRARHGNRRQRIGNIVRARHLQLNTCALRASSRDHIEGNGAQFFKEACKLGLEGIVSKLADSAYESTRSRNWMKIKCIKRQEFVIAGYTLSDKGIPFSSLILGVYDKGKLIYAGRAGTGYTNTMRVELKKELDRIAVEKRPFAEIPKDPGLRRAVWTEPKFVGEVAFTEWTDEGVIRHPSFQGLREDKKPTDVVREDPS